MQDITLQYILLRVALLGALAAALHCFSKRSHIPPTAEGLMGQDMSTAGSSSSYHDWSSELSEDELLLPHREPTGSEWGNLSLGTPAGLVEHRKVPDPRASRQSSSFDQEARQHQQQFESQSVPRQPIYHDTPPLDLMELHNTHSRDSVLDADHSRALSITATLPRLYIDSSDTLQTTRSQLPPQRPVPKHPKQKPLPAPPSTASTLAAHQNALDLPATPTAHHHGLRSSHSGNPIVLGRDLHATAGNEPRIHFHEEKSMQSVNGGRHVGKVVDNEWKELDKGMKRRMQEGRGDV